MTIAVGLTGAGLAGLFLGYADVAVATIAAALALSLLATLALIGLWAALADLHGERRAVAMTEGEVAVSLAGAVTPALIAALAATALGWRFAFVVAAAWAAATAVIILRVVVPPALPAAAPGGEAPPAALPATDAGASPAAAPPRRRTPPPTLLLAPAVVALEFALSFWLASYLEDDVGLPRDAAVAAVSGLYLANLVGRLVASRLVRRTSAKRVLAAALTVVLAGLPFLLLAESAAVAAVGIALAGAGIGATFPLASSLHIEASARSADSALGQTLATVSIGQLIGPLAVGVIAQVASLRAGLLILPALTLLAATALALTPQLDAAKPIRRRRA